MKALVLASGGIDSTIMLYEYKESIKKVLFFNYGSKHNDMEVTYLYKTCAKLNLPLILVDITSVFMGIDIKSALMKGGNDVPRNKELTAEEQKDTVVPFRNGILISLATATAIVDGLSHVLVGAHKSDAHTYPDCRVDFASSMGDAVVFGSDGKVSLFYPYVVFTKEEVVKKSKMYDVNLYEETYSCYEGFVIHCGNCAACISRRNALGKYDNTQYKNGYFPK